MADSGSHLPWPGPGERPVGWGPPGGAEPVRHRLPGGVQRVIELGSEGRTDCPLPGGKPRSSETFLRVSVRPQFLDILPAAQPGSVDPGVDPDDVIDMLLGTALIRLILPVATERQRPVKRTVEMILRLLPPQRDHVADQ